MSDSYQNDVTPPPNRNRRILLKARKGALRGGIAVFVVILILALVVRGSQFSALGWVALSMLLRLDLPIAFCSGLLGALVGGVTGAILAFQGAIPKPNSEPRKHPLD